MIAFDWMKFANLAIALLTTCPQTDAAYLLKHVGKTMRGLGCIFGGNGGDNGPPPVMVRFVVKEE